MSKDLNELREDLDRGLSGIKALDLPVKETALSVLALAAPFITMEMRRIANALDNITEALYSNQKQ